MHADLLSVFNYLRRNVHLKIPSEWAHVISGPTALLLAPEPEDLEMD